MFNKKLYDKKYYKLHKTHCKQCNSIISGKTKSKLCRTCCRLEQAHSNFKHGKRCRYTKHYCLNCHKIIYCISKRCKSCARRGKNNPSYKIKKNTIIKHHIYLKENKGKTLKLNRSKHTQLHNRAYEYIYKQFGEIGINNYIKWFKKHYGLTKTKGI